MAEKKIINVYGINLTDEEKIEWSKRERKTWLEYEIPVSLKGKLTKIIEKNLKKHYLKNQKIKTNI